jgi:hypothetical protein
MSSRRKSGRLTRSVARNTDSRPSLSAADNITPSLRRNTSRSLCVRYPRLATSADLNAAATGRCAHCFRSSSASFSDRSTSLKRYLIILLVSKSNRNGATGIVVMWSFAQAIMGLKSEYVSFPRFQMSYVFISSSHSVRGVMIPRCRRPASRSSTVTNPF